MTKIPPEAPIDGLNTKESKACGQKILMKLESKCSFLVSYRQTISQLLSTILSLIEFHLLSEFSPLTFQQRTFHCLFVFIGDTFALGIRAGGQGSLQNRSKEEDPRPNTLRLPHLSSCSCYYSCHHLHFGGS